MKRLFTLLFFFLSFTVFSSSENLISLGNYDVLIPSHYNNESSEKVCMLKELEKNLSSFNTFYGSENLLNTFIKNHIQVEVRVKKGIKKVQTSLTDRLVINIPDLEKNWCNPSKVTRAFKEAQKNLKSLLDETLNEKIVHQLEKITLKLESNQIPCESLEEKRQVYAGFKYNEVTDEIFYPNEKPVLISSLKDELRIYFYQNRENGSTSHLVKNGSFSPVVILGGVYSGCTEIKKRSEKGEIQVSILEKECEQREAPLKENYHVETCRGETFYLKEKEIVTIVDEECKVILPHQFISPFKGEMVILNKNQDVIDSDNGEIIVTLNPDQKVNWLNGKRVITSINQKVTMIQGKEILVDKNQDVIDGSDGEEIVNLAEDEKVVFMDMKRVVIKKDQHIGMFQGKPIILDDGDEVIDTDEGEDIVRVEEGQRIGFVNNRRVVLDN